MKKLAYTFASLFALTFALPASSDSSDGGEMTFSGVVRDSTCIVNGNGTGDPNFTVNLPRVSASALDADGKTAGDTKFTVALNNCFRNLDISLWYEPAYVDLDTGNLRNNAANPAENVQVEILTDELDPINLGNNTLKDSGDQLPREPIIDGFSELTYFAHYIAVGAPAKGGYVESKVTYSIAYW